MRFFPDVVGGSREVGAVLEDFLDQVVPLVLERVAHADFAGVGAGPEGVVLGRGGRGPSRV